MLKWKEQIFVFDDLRSNRQIDFDVLAYYSALKEKKKHAFYFSIVYYNKAGEGKFDHNRNYKTFAGTYAFERKTHVNMDI